MSVSQPAGSTMRLSFCACIGMLKDRVIRFEKVESTHTRTAGRTQSRHHLEPRGCFGEAVQRGDGDAGRAWLPFPLFGAL